MANLVFIGDSVSAKNFAEAYIEKNNFKPFEIEYFEEKIKIEHARSIKKTLSLKIPSQKLFVLSGEFTGECQNAILKTLEECAENIHFLFCVENEEQLLETIRSRCLIRKSGFENGVDEQLYASIRAIKQGERLNWDEIERLGEYVKRNGITPLMPALRLLLLQNLDDRKSLHTYYVYCQKLLKYSLLVKNNNVSERVIIEKVFLP